MVINRQHKRRLQQLSWLGKHIIHLQKFNRELGIDIIH